MRKTIARFLYWLNIPLRYNRYLGKITKGYGKCNYYGEFEYPLKEK